MMTTGVLQEEEIHPDFRPLLWYSFMSSQKKRLLHVKRQSAHSAAGAAVSFVRFDGWRWIGGCRMLERGEGRAGDVTQTR